MSSQVSEILLPSPELNNDATPPRATPSPDTADPELKLSRKREREVSVEPVTTHMASNDKELGLKRKFLERGTSQGSNNEESNQVSEPSKRPRDDSDKGDNSRETKRPSPPPSPPKPSPPPKASGFMAYASTSSPFASTKGQNVFKSGKVTPTPSPDTADPELKLSRKREREVSVEPVTTLTASNDKELGLKRKFLERGTSQGPNNEESNQVPEPSKRPRDDSDKDDNSRETKRPSPPPSPPKPSPPPKASGFMAYASTISPFASTKGQNVFKSGKASPSPFSNSSASSVAPPDPNAINATASQSSIMAPTASRRSGFAAFASTPSPFAAAARTKSPISGSSSILDRAKSPSRRTKSAIMSNSFASYAAGATHSFAIPAPKRVRAESSDGSSRSSLERKNSTVSAFGDSADSGREEDDSDNPTSSFGERLRAAKDHDDEMLDGEPKVQLSEQDVTTGEEDEDTIYSVRGKLFSLDDNLWKEKGTGLLKLNVKREDGKGARLVMRKDAVYTVILNVTLFGGMRCSLAQDRYLRVSAIENGVTTTYNIKVSNAGIARDLMEEINSNIPSKR